MSINGSINYSLQNIENTNLNQDIYNSLDYRIAQNENDIIALEEKDIEHDGQIASINTSLNNYNTRITQNENNISALQTTTQNHETRLTDISYSDDGLSGLTTIANKLLVQARHDWGIFDDCHIELRNSSVDTAQQFKTQLFTGIESTLHQDAKIAVTGDTCIVNVDTNNTGVSKGITLCGRYGTHSITSQGLRISLDPAGQSRYNGPQFVFDCKNADGSNSSVIFMQEFFIYSGGIGKTLNTYLTDSVVGVRTTGQSYNVATDTTTFDNNVIISSGKTLTVDGLNIKNQLDTNTNNITTNTNNITTNTNNITTNTNNISSLQSTLSGITYTSGTDTTTINNNVIISSGKSLTVDGLNVKSNIDTINTKITGITYNTTGDLTTIDNNLILPSTKTLTATNANITNLTVDRLIYGNQYVYMSPSCEYMFETFNRGIAFDITGSQTAGTQNCLWANTGTAGHCRLFDYTTIDPNTNCNGVMQIYTPFSNDKAYFQQTQFYTPWRCFENVGMYVMTDHTQINKTRIRYGITTNYNWGNNSFCLRNVWSSSTGLTYYYAEINGTALGSATYAGIYIPDPDPVPIAFNPWTNVSGFTVFYHANPDTYCLIINSVWIRIFFVKNDDNTITLIINGENGETAQCQTSTNYTIADSTKITPMIWQEHIDEGINPDYVPVTWCDWIQIKYKSAGISV